MRASRNGLAHLLKLIRVQLDRERFGPWALITGAASGIGREFALQIAACGIHVAGSRCRAAGHEEDARELSVRLFCAFQDTAAVAHAANDPT
jgi:NAD(P)-dependent dehydrogenase (short-subunit alcohol dehydrogenase family)